MTDAAASSASSADPAIMTPASSSPSPPPLPSLPFRPIVAPLIAHRATATAVGIASAAQVVLTTLHLPGMPCPFLKLTGIPCPGCGLSRACAAMVSGDVQHSLHMHVFAIPVLMGVTTLLVAALLPTPARIKMSKTFERLERTTGLSFLLLAALLVYWLGRLLYAPHAFMSLVAQH